MQSAELCLWPSIGEKFTDGAFQIHSNHPEASPKYRIYSSTVVKEHI